jgi:hypothetical protein
MTNVLGLPATSRVCLLLVDGLEWRQLRSHGAEAPFLSSMVANRGPITAGCQTANDKGSLTATVAASIAVFGTGVPQDEHG